MKNKELIISVLVVIAGLIYSDYEMNTYETDQDYSIKFSTGKAEGVFNDLTGTVDFNPNDLLNSSINVSVHVNSIQTGNKKKDKHAAEKKWFHAKEHPKISFKSKKFEKAGAGYIVEGELTIKGITREESIPFTLDKEESGDMLNGVFRVNRKDYKVNGGFFGFAVGKKVDVTLKVPLGFHSSDK